MNAKRTEPRVHCYQRPLHGGYVPCAATTPEHLRAVFEAERQRLADAAEAERQRLADAAKPRLKRRATASPAIDPKQAQLQLVA